MSQLSPVCTGPPLLRFEKYVRTKTNMFLLFSGLKRGLEKFEIPTALTLIGESWTPESGVITAAFKLKRKVIQNIYQRDIDKMYA